MYLYKPRETRTAFATWPGASMSDQLFPKRARPRIAIASPAVKRKAPAARTGAGSSLNGRIVQGTKTCATIARRTLTFTALTRRTAKPGDALGAAGTRRFVTSQ